MNEQKEPKPEKETAQNLSSKKRGYTITLAALLVLLILAAAAWILLIKPSGVRVNPTPDESANEPDTADSGNKESVIANEPLPQSTFVRSDLDDEFKYDLYEDYAQITKCLIRTSSVVTVPETIENRPVLSLKSGAFSGCALMEELILPDALREIGGSCFTGCTALKYLKLPGALYEIGDNAFQNCLSLTEVVFPQGLQRIGNYAFDETPFYEENHEEFFLVGDGILIGYWGGGGEVILPENVKMISSFSYHPGEETSPAILITGLELPEGLREIGDYALTACLNVGSIQFPSTLKTIGNNAFSGCSMLTDVRLPAGLESIGDHAFAFCENLKTISYPESLSFIGADQFENGGDGLERIYLVPDSFAMRHFQSSPYADLIVEDTE